MHPEVTQGEECSKCGMEWSQLLIKRLKTMEVEIIKKQVIVLNSLILVIISN
jgi:hypothetical protein